jgi:CRISPR-associated protein Cmr4
MGAGTALGLIDNPIQRERHTEHPLLAGSGIKGALRHALAGKLRDEVQTIFGPEAGSSSEHAGAVSFSDAQLVLFPIRSIKEGFVYATSSLALAKLARLLDIAGISDHRIKCPTISAAECIANDSLLSGNTLYLENYAYTNKANSWEDFKPAAEWLGENAVPANDSFEFFREKIKNHTIVLNDSEFSFFVKNATGVEPHVRIDDASGTAKEGGLFYTENLPPETVLVSLVMASDSRRKEGEMSAPQILEKIQEHCDGKPFQLGGDATTGRGQVILRFCGGGS